MIAISVAALSFSPQFAQFDMTKPIRLLGYAIRRGTSNSFEWCLLLEKREGANLGGEIKGLKEPVYLKEINGKVLLAYDKTLSKSITSIPSPDEKDSDSDILAVFHPEKYFSAFPNGLETFRKEMVRQIMMKKGREDEDFNEMKFLNIKLGAFENILRQCARLEMKIKFCDDSIEINSEFIPLPESSAEKFFQNQKSGGKVQKSQVPMNELEAFGRIAMDNELKNAILNMTREALVETADESNSDIVDLFSILTDRYSGTFKFIMESFEPGSPVCLEIEANDEKKKEISKFLYSNKSISETGKEIFTFNKGKKDSKFNFFLVTRDNAIFLIYGKTDLQHAEKMIPDHQSKTAVSENAADIRADAYSKSAKMDPLFSSILVFNGKKIGLNIEIFIEGIKRIIPRELLEKQKNLNQQ